MTGIQTGTCSGGSFFSIFCRLGILFDSTLKSTLKCLFRVTYLHYVFLSVHLKKNLYFCKLYKYFSVYPFYQILEDRLISQSIFFLTELLAELFGEFLKALLPICVPAACAPAVCVSAVCIPAVCTPAVCTPAVCTPAVCTPAVCVSAVCVPAVCVPAVGTHICGMCTCGMRTCGR